ncbi:MAG: DUF1749 domain-containing protein, partial [Candidatus Micrarchaeota archaeon]|nr:DUF1749 domain-containing protein [Candidatus Micrarchaeota archaeon]
MAARVFIVHGWMGTPQRDWLPWLKRELQKKGMEVIVPKMPSTNRPDMKAWIKHLNSVIGRANKNTYLIGHSIGGQAILRYLQSLNRGKIGGAIIVASWTNRRKGKFRSSERAKMMSPWLKTPFLWNNIKGRSESFVAIYSTDDPYVPQSAGKELKRKLHAKLVVI